MMIRELTPEELPKLIEVGTAFFVEAKLKGQFNPDHFVKVWGHLIDSRKAMILVPDASDDVGILAFIGGTVAENLLSKDIEATEAFWYVKPEARKTGIGIRLLQEFEARARARGALRCWMANLVDLNDEQMVKLYTKLGYVLKEKFYQKALWS